LAEQTHSCTDEVKWRGEATVDSSTLNFTPIVAGWKKIQNRSMSGPISSVVLYLNGLEFWRHFI